ncbi:MAG: Rpn family recombination-promoting nuclease/putative transposase [Selenomonadaceae bacterium]|nr:Rpn family recombination-promoting nuclease/putative transposase [Selenomonadaceae bacterium]
MAEKDITQKRLEDYPDVFADIFNVLLFKGEQVIKPTEEDLEPALPRSIYKMDEKIHEQERDVAKFWRSGQIRLALLGLENQSKVDNDMPLRVIGYDGAAYREQLNHDEESKPKMRYPVVTLVLYFGEKHWTAPRSLKKCFDIPPALNKFVNDYKIRVIEVAWLSDSVINKFQSDFRIVANFFKQRRLNKGYIASKQEWRHVQAVLELLAAATRDDRYVLEYDKEKERPKDMDAWLTEKINGGIAQGEKRLSKLMNLLLTSGKNQEAIEATTNPARRMELYREYNIALT